MATLTLDTQRNVLILAIKGEQPRTLRMKDSKASLYDLYKQARDLADVEPEAILDLLDIHTLAAEKPTNSDPKRVSIVRGANFVDKAVQDIEEAKRGQPDGESK
jgi:hypothetical protein